MIVFLCVEVQLKKRDKMRIVMRTLVSYVNKKKQKKQHSTYCI